MATSITPTPSQTTTATTTTGPPTFAFPREYFFPAFFTRQTNLNTLHAQLVKWSTLVLSYCRHHRLFKLSLSPNPTTSNNPNAADPTAAAVVVDTEELFHNRKLNRRLALADIREVIDFMRKEGRAEYVSSSSSTSSSSEGAGGAAAGGDVVWVYWRTPEEWAALIEGWVDETAQKGTVLTLYELVEGEGTRGTGMFFFLSLSSFLLLHPSSQSINSSTAHEERNMGYVSDFHMLIMRGTLLPREKQNSTDLIPIYYKKHSMF